MFPLIFSYLLVPKFFLIYNNFFSLSHSLCPNYHFLRNYAGWMASLTQVRWTWVWTSSGSWWWTVKPGLLQSMGLQTRLSDWTDWCCASFFSHVWLFVTPWTVPARLLCPWDSSDKNIGLGCHALLPGDVPNPGIKPTSPELQVDSLPSEPPGKLREKQFSSANQAVI